MKKVLAVLAIAFMTTSVFAGELSVVDITRNRTPVTPGNYETIPHVFPSESLPSILTIMLDDGSIHDLDITGVRNWDLPGSLNNETLTVDIAALAGRAAGTSTSVTGIGWDVNILPVGASWFSEAAILFNDELIGLSLTPGTDDEAAADASDIRNYASGGLVILADLDLDLDGIPDGIDAVYSGGVMLLEFAETFDDVTDEVDSAYVKGVPEPASASLLLVALFGMLGIRRRR